MSDTSPSRTTAELLKRADELEASILRCLKDTNESLQDIDTMLARIEKNAARMKLLSGPRPKPNKAHLRLVVNQ